MTPMKATHLDMLSFPEQSNIAPGNQYEGIFDTWYQIYLMIFFSNKGGICIHLAVTTVYLHHLNLNRCVNIGSHDFKYDLHANHPTSN